MFIRHRERASGDYYQQRVDVSDLAAGIYMVEIRSGEHQVNRRLSVK